MTELQLIVQHLLVIVLTESKLEENSNKKINNFKKITSITGILIININIYINIYFLSSKCIESVKFCS